MKSLSYLVVYLLNRSEAAGNLHQQSNQIFNPYLSHCQNPRNLQRNQGGLLALKHKEHGVPQLEVKLLLESSFPVKPRNYYIGTLNYSYLMFGMVGLGEEVQGLRREPWLGIKGFTRPTFQARFLDEGHCQTGLEKTVLNSYYSLSNILSTLYIRKVNSSAIYTELLKISSQQV